jgi:hypothetical protein
MRKCTICGKGLDKCGHVPSKRYDIFITAFDKLVAEAQKEIAKADKLMRPYEIVRGVMERADLKNDVSLYLKPGEIHLYIRVMDDDHREVFDQILREIGRELRGANLHPSGNPGVFGEGSITLQYFWRLRGIDDDDPPTVNVYINTPLRGTNHIKVEAKQISRTYTNTEYTVTWLEGRPTGKGHDDDEKDEIPF